MMLPDRLVEILAAADPGEIVALAVVLLLVAVVLIVDWAESRQTSTVHREERRHAMVIGQVIAVAAQLGYFAGRPDALRDTASSTNPPGPNADLP